MTYKEAREYLIPIAANCVLPQYAAALEKAMEALELAESVVRCKECKHEEECMKQLVFWERDHVLEQNVYQYHKLDFCSYGERRADNA